MEMDAATHVVKAYAYVTRNDEELLVFRGPEYDGLQVPKGTVESVEDPRQAVVREVVKESGLAALGRFRHLTTDVWTRRREPLKRYVRHFFHTDVYETRDSWTHVVTGAGAESGHEFDFSWVDLPLRPGSSPFEFAFGADDHLDLIEPVQA